MDRANVKKIGGFVFGGGFAAFFFGLCRPVEEIIINADAISKDAVNFMGKMLDFAAPFMYAVIGIGFLAGILGAVLEKRYSGMLSQIGNVGEKLMEELKLKKGD